MASCSEIRDAKLNEVKLHTSKATAVSTTTTLRSKQFDAILDNHHSRHCPPESSNPPWVLKSTPYVSEPSGSAHDAGDISPFKASFQPPLAARTRAAPRARGRPT